MNISYRWLLPRPGPRRTPRELADRLAMLGAPGGRDRRPGRGLGDVVIARVDEVRQHPNADRLRICTVDAGGDALQVVCGAPNVEAGASIRSRRGRVLPGGFGDPKAKLRGEVSEGMLCSPRELGLGRDHDGLMTLHGEWEPGAALSGTRWRWTTRGWWWTSPPTAASCSRTWASRASWRRTARTGSRLPPFPGGFRGDLAAEPGRRREARPGR
jgi:tRNA-binding EMAP/Myf-like protein